MEIRMGHRSQVHFLLGLLTDLSPCGCRRVVEALHFPF